MDFFGGGSVSFNFQHTNSSYPIILFSLYPVVAVYAMFRYQLFDVKVITTEILVFVLWFCLCPHYYLNLV